MPSERSDTTNCVLPVTCRMMTTPITQTEAYIRKLRAYVEPPDVMKKYGYITRPLTDEELLLKRRCLGCGKAMSQLAPKRTECFGLTIPTDAVDEAIASITSSGLTLKDGILSSNRPSVNTNFASGAFVPDQTSRGKSTHVPASRCRYHPGQVFQKHWTCCKQHVTAKPCGGSDTHSPRPDIPGELAKQYQFHYTPSTPSRDDDIHAAVALDCEMGAAASGDSELIRLTLIDFFSAAVLLDNIIEPDVPMQHLNTRYSGISWADVRKARKEKTLLEGNSAAREALWRFVGPETVVVGHGASNDLRALRWIHELVVDSFVAESGTKKRKEVGNADQKKIEEKKNVEGVLGRAVGAPLLGKDKNERAPTIGISESIVSRNVSSDATKSEEKARKRKSGHMSLKALVNERLHRNIQMGGKSGHDSLEDAIAARDLVHWIINN